MPLDTGGDPAPATPEELCALVRGAVDAGTPLALAGSGTRLGLGRPAADTAQRVSLRGLSGVREYSPTELYVTVGAGTPVAEVAAALAERDQHMLFEPPDHRALFGTKGEPTIGGAVSCGLSGPARIAGGSIRDTLIGVQAVTGRAEAIRSGGRVMKNVTGYDLCKLAVGAFGTLGALTELTFKVLPRPRRRVTLMLRGLGDADARAVLSRGLGSPFEVDGAAHLPAGIAARSAVASVRDGAATLLRLGGFAESLDYRVEELRLHLETGAEIARLDDAETDTVWAEIRDVRLLADPADGAIWRVSVAPTDGPALATGLCQALAAEAFYDWGCGLVWLAVADRPDAGAGAVRAAVADAGGSAMLVRAPDAVRTQVPVLPPLDRVAEPVSRRLKAAFDPAGILNPGRMYAGM